ncbi:MAG TPA: hypothetical protein VF469_07240 [Kofleriaceae bacterium]
MKNTARKTGATEAIRPQLREVLGKAADDQATVQLVLGLRHVVRENLRERFLRVIFGAVDETPTPDEHAMFLAYASSLRSADLSRQVGAVLWKDHVGVVGAGCNDVPSPGGGLYWPGPADQRDHALGHDANERHKRAIANEVAGHVVEALQLKPEQIPDREGMRRNAAPRYHGVWTCCSR